MGIVLSIAGIVVILLGLRDKFHSLLVHAGVSLALAAQEPGPGAAGMEDAGYAEALHEMGPGAARVLDGPSGLVSARGQSSS